MILVYQRLAGERNLSEIDKMLTAEQWNKQGCQIFLFFLISAHFCLKSRV